MRSRRWYRLLTVALIAFVISSMAPRAALADTTWPYASVVCDGNKALVRFVFALNQDTPTFIGSAAKLPDAIARELDHLTPADPSQCKLADGREVVLRQGDKDDGRARGACGADTTELFSLWIGKRPVYRRETWHNKCGFPYEITAITLDGEHLTECRLLKKGVFEEETTSTCQDSSKRLRTPVADPGHPGKLVLLRAASGMGRFCRGLVKTAPAGFNDRDVSYATDWQTWPTYQRTGIEVIFDILEQDRLQEQATKGLFDLDNSGRPSHALLDDKGWRYGSRAKWALLPPDATPEAMNALMEKLWPVYDEIALRHLRASGTTVFAGDQTAFGTLAFVHLTPFRRDNMTWMLAESELPSRATDIVLKPTPRGTMKEVCAFAATPPL